MQRCDWVNNDQRYLDYHDHEWGKAEFDNQKLFEQLCLEGQQAGLSWITVLKKRDAYRRAFHHFVPEKIAQMSDAHLDQLMQDPALIRHRGKLAAIIKNAQAYLTMQANGEDFSTFIWQFVDHQCQRNDVPNRASLPNQTATSLALSRALKQRGFVFVGPTICYAFMQSVGMVDDHLNHCFCKAELPPPKHSTKSA